MSITDKSAEADFFCGIFATFSRQYKLSTPKTCISQKHLDDTPLLLNTCAKLIPYSEGKDFFL